jgi:hypothetical protein
MEAFFEPDDQADAFNVDGQRGNVIATGGILLREALKAGAAAASAYAAKVLNEPVAEFQEGDYSEQYLAARREEQLQQAADMGLDNAGAGEDSAIEAAYEQQQLMTNDNYDEEDGNTTSTVVHVNQGDRLSSDELVVPLTMIFEGITPTSIRPGGANPTQYQQIIHGNFVDSTTGGLTKWSKLYSTAMVLESTIEVRCNQYDFGTSFPGSGVKPAGFIAVWPDLRTTSTPYDKYHIKDVQYMLNAKYALQPLRDPSAGNRAGAHSNVVNLKHYMSTAKMFGMRENQLDGAFFKPAAVGTASLPTKYWVWRLFWSFLPESNVSVPPQVRLEVKVTYLVKLMGRFQDIAPTNYTS